MIVDGQEMSTLDNSGAQVSSVSSQFCEDLALQIQPLGQLLELEGTGGAAIPYLGFIEVNFQIPGIKNYNEDVLLLVIPTTTYSKMIPVMVGPKIIDRALSFITKGEPAKATITWRQAYFGAVMSGSLQLTPTSSDKTRMEEEVGHSSQSGDPVEVRKFCLSDVRGPVCTTQKVTIPPFSTVSVHANSSVKGHCMQVHVLVELMPGPQMPAAVVLTATYRELHPGSSRVPICLHNLSTHAMELHAKAVVGQVAPSKQVPQVVQPTRTSKESNHKPQNGWVLEALDLQGLQEWPESEQKQASNLLLKWEHLFACSVLDLDKTALIKHKMVVTDQIPFKEHYQHIPPHMYSDVRAHIQEIRAIQKSHNPWVSTVVLVWKKYGSQRFCIDLRKLNNQTIKDVYSLPCIDKTLDSLQDSQCFSSLDLKLGYWQV